MRRIIIFILAIQTWGIILSQAPEKMSFQAVIRDSNSALVQNTQVGIQISILQGTVNGSASYIEQHSLTTNGNGLATLEIGNGTSSIGSFSSIDWSNGPYFLKTETDLTGGMNYTISGTSQLLSVPYALHAATAGSTNETDPVFGSSIASGITGADTANWNNKLSSEVDGSVTNEIQHLSISNDTITLDNNGGSIVLPGNNAYQTQPIGRGPLPIGATCTDSVPYIADSVYLDKGIYMYMLYSCGGQINQTGYGFDIDHYWSSASGDASGTFHDFIPLQCGHYYTGVIRVISPGQVSIRYSSHGGSSFLVTGGNVEFVEYWKISQ